MGKTVLLHLFFAILAFWSVSLVRGEDGYKYFTWTITYGTASPLGASQQVGTWNYLFITFYEILIFSPMMH